METAKEIQLTAKQLCTEAIEGLILVRVFLDTVFPCIVSALV